MPSLSLQQQLLDRTSQLTKRIGKLDAADPNRGWFQGELRQIAIADDGEELSLEEANARLSAVRQLTMLLRTHCVRLQNPNYADAVSDAPDSYLTVMARLPQVVLDSTRDLGFSISPDLLHQDTPDNESFDPVSPTAKIVAYLRGLDAALQIDGGFCPKTEGESLLNELGITDPETQQSMAVLFQSRYHSINAAISSVDSDVVQVIEFASGISPRGYQWSRMNPGTIYLESDLPQLMIHKSKLIRNVRLAQQQKSRGLHHCSAADVLDLASVQKAIEVLDTSAPFTIVTEGLLLYFSEAEMKQFLSNMRAVLSAYPNARWVTDFVTKENLKDLFESHSGVATSVRSVFSMVGRNVVPDNPFQNDDGVREFLSVAGLNVTNSRPLVEITPDLSLDLVSNEQRRAIVGNRCIWTVQA